MNEKKLEQEKVTNNGERIVKQVSNNPQNRALNSNVDDLLKAHYNQSPSTKLQADLIERYNQKGYSVGEIDKLHTEALDINKAMDEEALVKSYLE